MSVQDPAGSVDLVRRIVAGEEKAETELVERCGPVLRFLTRRFTRTEADAEDLYQETLMLALEKIRDGQVREPERLAGFLRALAKNLSTQEYRRRRHRVEKPAAELPRAELLRPELQNAADFTRGDALDTLLHRERSQLTRALLAELAVPRDREILFRYYIGEENSASICGDLGIEGDHFYRVLSRARQRYRRLWEDHHPEATLTSAGDRQQQRAMGPR